MKCFIYTGRAKKLKDDSYKIKKTQQEHLPTRKPSTYEATSYRRLHDLRNWGGGSCHCLALSSTCVCECTQCVCLQKRERRKKEMRREKKGKQGKGTVLT